MTDRAEMDRLTLRQLERLRVVQLILWEQHHVGSVVVIGLGDVPALQAHGSPMQVVAYDDVTQPDADPYASYDIWNKDLVEPNLSAAEAAARLLASVPTSAPRTRP